MSDQTDCRECRASRLQAADADVTYWCSEHGMQTYQQGGSLEATHAAAKHVVDCFVQLGRCGDEFGWDDERGACAEYRDALDAAIIKLAEAAHLCYRCGVPVPKEQVPPALCGDCLVTVAEMWAPGAAERKGGGG